MPPAQRTEGQSSIELSFDYAACALQADHPLSFLFSASVALYDRIITGFPALSLYAAFYKIVNRYILPKLFVISSIYKIERLFYYRHTSPVEKGQRMNQNNGSEKQGHETITAKRTRAKQEILLLTEEQAEWVLKRLAEEIGRKGA